MSVRSVSPDIYDDPNNPNGTDASDGYPTPSRPIPQTTPQPLPLAPAPTQAPSPSLPVSTQPVTQPTAPSQPSTQPTTQAPTPDPMAFQPPPVTADPQAPSSTDFTFAPYTTTDNSGTTFTNGYADTGNGGSEYVSAFASPPDTSLTPQTSSDYASGVMEYGREWMPNAAPPAGLSDADLQAWQQAHPNNIGYNPDVWQYAADTLNGKVPHNPDGSDVTPPNITPMDPIIAPAQSTSSASNTSGSSTPYTPPPVTPISVPTAVQVAAPSMGGYGSSGTDANGLPIPTNANGLASYVLNPTTPSNSLTNQTITPGPAVDRFKIAQDRYDAAVAASEPQYEADLRDANRYAAAGGAIGSGALNTSLGNIANQRQNTLATQRSNFLNDALVGSIQDAYQNIGIAQQQQGFQADEQKTAFNQQLQVQQLMDSEQGQLWAQQLQAAGFNAQQIQQAFENAVQSQELSDSENNQAFMQAYDQYLAGTSGDPASYYEWLAGQYAAPAKAA